ncbi:hypothetical protein [Kitasatospora sp. NPDC093558]|uniref:hypothetical protein n=1 Tax=Kitasatospora sp. NPDC093558 TaxID=3155201 RepID=UPI00343F63F6
MKRRAALLAISLVPLLAACGHKTLAAADTCGQHVAGQTDPNRLAVYRVPVGKDSVQVDYRGAHSGDPVTAYLTTTNGTVVGRTSAAAENGKATIDVLCPGVTWAQVTNPRSFDYQAVVTITRSDHPTIVASEPLFVSGSVPTMPRPQP